MNEEVIELVEETESINPNAVYVVNIKYSSETTKKPKDNKKKHPGELFESYILDLPPKIFEMRNKDKDLYYDVVETFVYNTMTRKTGREVTHCQIYLADI